MPYRDVPAFMAKLKRVSAPGAKALRFLILTAARSSEVFEARWEEIDLDAKRWTNPGSRMKTKLEHIVPLSDAAVDLLQGQLASRRRNQAFVFPGARPGRPLSNMAMAMQLRRLGAGEYTVHGFRSAARDWMADHGVEFQLAEACLAHKIGNAASQAYLRSTMVERRRPIMAQWAAHVEGESGGNVIPMRRG